MQQRPLNLLYHTPPHCQWFAAALSKDFFSAICPQNLADKVGNRSGILLCHLFQRIIEFLRHSNCYFFVRFFHIITPFNDIMYYPLSQYMVHSCFLNCLLLYYTKWCICGNEVV